MLDTRFLDKGLTKGSAVALPLYKQPLLLQAKPTLLLLTAHKATRNNPIAYDYHGLTLYISTLEKDGTVNKLVVSYRETAGKRSKSDMGKMILRLAYSPKCNHDLPIDQPILPDVIDTTLDNVMPTLFLPKLFDEKPQLKTDMLSLAVLGPYALLRLQTFRNYEESTRIKQSNAMDVMLKLWGNQPLCNITPEYCAKDLLDQMPFSTAKECVRVLRQLFLAEFPHIVVDHTVWARYHLSAPKNSYSAPRVIRSKLLDNPLPAPMMVSILKVCMQHIADPTFGGRYLCTLCIILEALSVDEACALTVGSMIDLKQYPGKHALRIDHEINTHGSRSRGDGHVRDHRHTRDQILDEFQNRDIGVCDIVAEAWRLFMMSHTADNDRLIVTNPINQDRVLSPDTFNEWLETTFSVQLEQHAVLLGDQEIIGVCSPAERLAASAVSMMREHGRLSEEEIRYHVGDRPTKMDAQHYAGFAEESALLAVGEMLTSACQAIIHNVFSKEHDTHTQKAFGVKGIPGRLTLANITIKIPPVESDHDLHLVQSARFGFSAEITTK